MGLIGRALLLDTAGPVIGVAAFHAGARVYAAERRIVQGADTWLLPAMSDAVAALGGLPERVAVGVGPGAFTGVRVGVSAALGLAFAAGCGVVPVCSLALRAAAHPGHARVVVALDARKGRVYVRSFDTRGPIPVALDDPQDIAPEAAFVGEGLAVGEGAVVYADRLGGLTLAEHADACALGAAAALIDGAALDPAAVQLAYLRGEDEVVTRPKAHPGQRPT